MTLFPRYNIKITFHSGILGTGNKCSYLSYFVSNHLHLPVRIIVHLYLVMILLRKRKDDEHDQLPRYTHQRVETPR